MLFLFKVSLPIILSILSLVQWADGNQRVIYVSELVSESKDLLTDSEYDNSHICCMHGNCSCNSLDQALANLTSNVLINITTDVTLSSIIKVSNIENVTIIGYNKPTVNCKTIGGIHFTFCHNCIMQHITWYGCGTEDIDDHTEPGLKLSNSFNITINDCNFHHSKSQALLLSKLSGDVNINHCNFVHNTHRGHGAAIHYSSSSVTNLHQISVFTISDCNFTYNYAKSSVYIKNRISEHTNKISFQYTKFCHNQGVSVYAINQNIYLNGTFLFQNNSAKTGAGIYISDHSTVIFGENSNVTFTQNSAKYSGGTIFLRNSNVIFDQNSMATLNNNDVFIHNGTVYSGESSNITFKANCKVVFSHNSVNRGYGGAIFSYSNSHVIFEGNSTILISNNTVHNNGGGAIYSHNSYIHFEGNSSPVFCNNFAPSGGVIYSDNNSYIHFEGNSSPVFCNNLAVRGGVIYSDDNSYIIFEGNSSPVFSDNTADYRGGVIYSNDNSYIFFEGNSSPVFSDNTADRDGGVIYDENSYIFFKGISSPVFSNNVASDGGGIYSYDSFIHFKENSSPVFSSNFAKGYYDCVIICKEYTAGYGGAIHSGGNSYVLFNGSSTVEFSDNTAEYGGAIFTNDHCNVTFSDNSTVTFTNNNAVFGETVFSNTVVIITGNSTVLFNGVSPEWCNNSCIPYHDQGNVVTINSNGIVWCSDRKAFLCQIKKCYCNKLEDLLDGLKSNTIVNITGNAMLSSVIELENLKNISIVAYNITVICVNGGRLDLSHCFDLMIEGITWIGCGNNILENAPVISIVTSSGIKIQDCSFQYSFGTVIFLTLISEANINHCNFKNNNQYKDHGTVIYFSVYFSSAILTININNCNFSYNGNAKSIVYVGGSYFAHVLLNNSHFHNNQGGSFYLSDGSNLRITGEVLFENNVGEDGAGIYATTNSTVTFEKSANVKFINNSVYHTGAAIFLNDRSNAIFIQNSTTEFNNNKATNGTIYSKASCNILFEGNSETTFTNNSATQYGAAIYSFDNSSVTFTGNSTVTFTNNVVSSDNVDLQNGGTIYSEDNGCIYFEENALTMFSNNIADYGAAILSFSNSRITFKDNSMVIFNNNTAQICGVLASVLFSSIIYKGNTKVSYDTNKILCTLTSATASAMCSFQGTVVIFSGHSSVTYTNNTAGGGGALIVKLS